MKQTVLKNSAEKDSIQPTKQSKSAANSAPVSCDIERLEGVERKAKGKPSDSKELGRKGESAAARFLERKGFDILETNWTCFAGEADIIARDGSTLCFIEVKTRNGIQKGFPAEAVDAKKRARYEKIAACYLQTYEQTDIAVRFDIISILVLGPTHAFLRMHTNAFCFDD